MAILDNQVVSIEYKVIDTKTSQEVDSNIGQAPLEFIVGKNQIIPGLENGIRDLNSGDNSDIMVLPADAYGDYNPEAIDSLPKEQFAGIDLSIGMTLYGQGEDGQTIPVVVKDFNDEEVTLDYNHPMSGKELLFSVKILDIRDATEEEIATGVIGGEHSGGSCGSDGGSCGCSH